jgi:hypothetical protein
MSVYDVGCDQVSYLARFPLLPLPLVVNGGTWVRVVGISTGDMWVLRGPAASEKGHMPLGWSVDSQPVHPASCVCATPTPFSGVKKMRDFRILLQSW